MWASIRGGGATMGIRTICLGELLLRLSAPGRERLLQTPQLRVDVGGAEANVAVSLALLGDEAAFASVVPNGALGEAALGQLRRYGVDTRGVQRRDGRMGLYFLETGGLQRASGVHYDREASVFALGADTLDLDDAFAGAQWLHLSGVTPAIGPQGAALARRAMRLARERGLGVSFDGNYRASLWARWPGNAPAILRELFEMTDLLFGNHRDIGLVLGRDFGAGDPTRRDASAVAAAFEAFPALRTVACTTRVERSVDHHALDGLLATRDGLFRSRTFELDGIVDRIGTGDAFAAGVLHGLHGGLASQAAVDFGVAAAALKHSIPGDFNLATAAEVGRLLDDAAFAVRR